MRRPVIGVMGGSKANKQVCETARKLGELIARRGWILLNGGRNRGVMAASAAGARAAIVEGATGLVVGVLPNSTSSKASPDLDVAIVTGLGDARNLINVLSSDVVIACAGGLGTWSEIVLALKHHKHVIRLGATDAGLPSFSKYYNAGQLRTADTPEAAVEIASHILAHTNRSAGETPGKPGCRGE